MTNFPPLLHFSPHLSDELNQKIYGKCNNANGHGHNYSVEITLRGPVDAETGMVMNISDLKDHMDHTIMKNLDHKNLDKDVAFFKNTVSLLLHPYPKETLNQLLLLLFYSPAPRRTLRFTSGTIFALGCPNPSYCTR